MCQSSYTFHSVSVRLPHSNKFDAKTYLETPTTEHCISHRGPVICLTCGYLSHNTLPVRVDRAFIKLHRILCHLQLCRRILKLCANSAQTCVTLDVKTGRNRLVSPNEPNFRCLIAGCCSYLKCVGPPAWLIIQHMKKVTATLLRGTQVLQTDTYLAGEHTERCASSFVLSGCLFTWNMSSLSF